MSSVAVLNYALMKNLFFLNTWMNLVVTETDVRYLFKVSPRQVPFSDLVVKT